MNPNQLRFSSSNSTYQLKQSLQAYINRHSSQHKSSLLPTKSSKKSSKKSHNPNSPSSRSKLLKSFNHLNPTSQLQTLTTNISKMKLNNQILKAKVINENVRASKEQMNKAEYFIEEGRCDDVQEMERRIEEMNQIIIEYELRNDEQEKKIGRVKGVIGELAKENKRLKQKIKLKLKPALGLEVLLGRLRE